MHAAHVIPSGPVYPLLQVQLINIELPSAERVYAGHWLHVDSSISPVPDEYFPSEHCEHDDDPFTSLYVPAGQSLHVEAPYGRYLPAKHPQELLESAPAPIE